MPQHDEELKLENRTAFRMTEPLTRKSLEKACVIMMDAKVPEDAKVSVASFPNNQGFVVKAYWDTSA